MMEMNLTNNSLTIMMIFIQPNYVVGNNKLDRTLTVGDYKLKLRSKTLYTHQQVSKKTPILHL